MPVLLAKPNTSCHQLASGNQSMLFDFNAINRLPFGVALARVRVRAQQARRLVVQAERAAIMRHSNGMFFFHRLLLWLHFDAALGLVTVSFAASVSLLKLETVKKIQENIGNLSMIFDFDVTLVAAVAGLAEKYRAMTSENIVYCDAICI
ncbi:hypothetical protein AXG93_2841s1310 [Marchantia polymorpha subsp. ruderalis]|uniref:Uncharacterized protein n=1 Tax=Marchantia polymorpha subsp. ruderalis TaxID=1480154 RepID=A0A176WTG7_MARPO|nr:hypothetical protein AXG93_2841s1310 [Marchantia polymorpha subsp. ruderalis]